MKLINVIIIVSVLLGPQNNEAVISGEEASEGSIPFIVSLRVDKLHICAGSIIADDFILTAAHCCDGILEFPLDKTIIHAGTIYSDEPAEEKYKVRRVFQHPSYENEENVEYTFLIKHDICLLQLENEIKFQNQIKSIPIIKFFNAVDYVQNEAFVAGWGNEEEEDTFSELQILFTKTITVEKCSEILGPKLNFWNKMAYICILSPNSTGTCDGDSGGPLFFLDTYKQPILIGILSWGRGCANNQPDVFANVTFYVDWIVDTIHKAKSLVIYGY